MIERLSLLRHAKAVAGTLQQLDKTRGLSPHGAKNAYSLGAYLRRQNFAPDIILCSTATRTKETLTHLTGGYEKPIAPVQYLDSLYQASVEAVLKELEMLDKNIKHIMIIGHNPSMSEMLARLAPESDHGGHFPTCALANLVNFDGKGFSLDRMIINNSMINNNVSHVGEKI